MSYYSQYITVVAHNTEQHCGFGPALPTKESHITLGCNLSSLWQPLNLLYNYSILDSFLIF